METSEKVSVNMNIATLSQIDLLVDKGYYSNRSDFINQSVRQALNEKKTIIEETSKQHFRWFIGVMSLEKEELMKANEKQIKIKIKGYGLLGIDSELDDLVIENVDSIAVKGKVICSDRIKKHFMLR